MENALAAWYRLRHRVARFFLAGTIYIPKLETI
jgi:hypothetical protein